MGELTDVKPCAQQHYDVRPEDLPLSCPTKSMGVWNAHPRVYLDIKATGKVSCPYCGASYTLVTDD
jgi:uncharacterized Zn-finger protein